MIYVKMPVLKITIVSLIALFFLGSCAHPNAALGDYRGKYVRVGLMTPDSTVVTEVVLTSRGELFTKSIGTKNYVKKDQLPRLKTKTLILAVEKTGILEQHTNKGGIISTFYIQYHKRRKTYWYTWSELNWPTEVKDVYKDFESIK